VPYRSARRLFTVEYLRLVVTPSLRIVTRRPVQIDPVCAGRIGCDVEREPTRIGPIVRAAVAAAEKDVGTRQEATGRGRRW